MNPRRNIERKRRRQRRQKEWFMNGATFYKDGSVSIDMDRYDPTRRIPSSYHVNHLVQAFKWRPLFPDRAYNENPGVLMDMEGNPLPPAEWDTKLPDRIIYSETTKTPEEQAEGLKKAQELLAQFYNDHHTPDPS